MRGASRSSAPAFALVATLGATSLACAHDPTPPTASAGDRAPDPCAAKLWREKRDLRRLDEAKRVCAPFSPQTFNYRDCMIAHGIYPENPPPYHALDDDPCHDGELHPPQRRNGD